MPHSNHGELMDRTILSLVMQLQLSSLELNNSLEETCNLTLTSIPRSIREIEKARREATEIKKKLDKYVDIVSSLETETIDSLRLLSELDSIKMRIESVFHALREVEKVSRLTDSIESVFTTGDLQKIAEELCTMNDSLQHLRDIPEFKTQLKSVERYQERLEGLARPQLLQAFTSHDIETSQRFVNIFNKIDRNEQLMDIYYNTRLVSIQNDWNAFDRSQLPFHKWLPTFYDQTLLLINKEVSWSVDLFPPESRVVPTLIKSIFQSISMTFKKRIQNSLRPQEGQQDVSAVQRKPAIEHLITLFQTTCDFSRSVQSVLPVPEDAEETLRFIFEPFFSLQNEYAYLERTHLGVDIQALKIAPQAFQDTVGKIETNGPKLFILLDASIHRCILLTQGAEGEQLIDTISSLLSDWFQHITTLLQHLRQLAQLETPHASQSPLSPSLSAVYFDWSMVAGSLSFLQVVNKMRDRMSTFERNLKMNLLEEKSIINKAVRNQGVRPATLMYLKQYPHKEQRLVTFMETMEDVTKKLLPKPSEVLSTLSSSVHTLVFDTMFSFIKEKLESVPSLEVWPSQPQTSSLMPTFSISPSDYVTQIGEHLHGLPQQLEPFSGANNTPEPPRSTGVQNNSEDSDYQEDSQETPEEDEGDRFAFQWMSLVVRETMSLYAQRILDIKTLTDHGARQLSTDIDYLFVVIDALGVTADSTLMAILHFVKAERESYPKNAEEGEEHLRKRIANMRSLALE
ncbi:oligomeric Golgi complex subunit 7-like [Planoprotostelium fungivorum]|uniref:Conserved oligomeric Golgi complex subunit 7 n=1 Tax=Planoprotostelium fungivorum TaxID=1890364 RepID=A0A2P6N792_9EUKA|nr:oligomeric Golgi complex subunit 7-like [Planoprotostelium fungivorum]